MKTALPLLLLSVLLAAPGLALADDGYDALYGTWGTESQCAREALGPDGVVYSEPVEIGPTWLRQGPSWCRLRWFPLEMREEETFTGAFAQCGEDGIRDYRLRMELTGEALLLRWDLLYATGPLK